MRPLAGLLLGLGLAAAAFADPAQAVAGRLLAELDAQGAEQAIIAAQLRAGLERGAADPARLVEEALCLLRPDFAAALEAFDAGADADAHDRFAQLVLDEDPFIAAHAAYYAVRTLAARQLFEEADAALAELPPDVDVERYSPFGSAWRVLRAASQVRTLRFEQARETLADLEQGPEPVAATARQLRLELERRETGTLAEVATVMDYVHERLDVRDAGQRVRAKQGEILALLDKLIEQQEQQEGGGGGGGAQRRPGDPQDGRAQRPDSPPDESIVPPSNGAQIGDLHAAPRINPGELWGKLPPAERERILQAIRERYPSRYRQIVEQYYRSLSEEAAP